MTDISNCDLDDLLIVFFVSDWFRPTDRYVGVSRTMLWAEQMKCRHLFRRSGVQFSLKVLCYCSEAWRTIRIPRNDAEII